MIRDDIKAALVTSMKAGDKARTATLRLVQSAVKNRDIELRTAAAPPADDDATLIEVLQKMIKQRRESIALYEQGGRAELADQEKAEVAVIETFLPAQMDEEAAKAAIEALVAETGAASVKDMGRVMALVKSRFAGQMDMSRASALVKARLG
ncbi:MAG: GatB/YqeY domain-containing protein [Alphaproteobacteria bacterium]|nr:GatB/YqeY domain-containing protein [Alphaproteobacteria bacterium]MBV9371184.1 GatB/YqeY domain-containing protein [Alphaproteobacteria bacterium]MBV9899914.1 GatB/YqeY domain-containing protein [Alphaproteobacteria bacterium]